MNKRGHYGGRHGKGGKGFGKYGGKRGGGGGDRYASSHGHDRFNSQRQNHNKGRKGGLNQPGGGADQRW